MSALKSVPKPGTAPSRPLAAALLLLCLAPLPVQAQSDAAVAPSAAPSAARIEIAATPIERLEAGGGTRFGALEFRGGLVLSSAAADFGGLSGLVVDPDGAGFVAVTDRGFWLSGRIRSEGDRPTGIADARLARLRAAGGGTLAGRRRGDAESLARTKAGYLVGIERRQELWLFPGDDPLTSAGRRLLADPALATLGGNQGPEALLAPPDGTPSAIVVIGEESPDDAGILPGFLFAPLGKPVPAGRFSIRRSDDFAATDAALADDGTVYLLERRFDFLRGVAMRIRRFPLSEIRPGARVEGEVVITANRLAAIDNMEGLALHRNAAGELILTLVSDDNFSALQRTLLLRFAVVD
ncbi:hypothetical protein FO470_01205 [Starkeya sp. 3C]|uniref:Phytase-like domain-containing protein n=1 Tax=Ancylobacter moscoviensis TaxID=2597768 RepID=A0ABY3DUD7_9HYPH|nr:esterase-like activity of phytase family protein [Ancylobacter moscoviensis]TSJ63948.1 hypothetical protein FO470_01205 [Ancylobacter moscoviensis]